MKAFVLTLLAILLLAASARFIRALGDVKVQSLLQVDSDVGAARADATAALLRILQEGSAYAGDEVLVPTRQHARPDDGTHHIRFKQHVEGRPIEGASMVMHIRRENGTVYAVNGEFHPSTSIDPFEPNLDCETAMELARQEEHDLANGKWKWEGNCVDAVVQGRDGRAHFAYRRTLRYRQNDGSHSLDILFASPRDGLLLAVHPQLFRIRSLATIHCSELNESSCSLISTSPDKISIPYPAAQDAHNNVVDVYDFYEAQFGRLSIDGQEGAIGIVVGLNFSDSFFVAPNFLVFGNGNATFKGLTAPTFRKDLTLVSCQVYQALLRNDSATFTLSANFSLQSRAPISSVAHEYSHGVVYHESNLTYESESGSLTEAFGDIMAATADRLVRRTTFLDTWRIGEDVDIWDDDNKTAIRNLYIPWVYDDPYHYADRGWGDQDSGYVHTNSLIVGHAFYLMVTGGVHDVTGISVPPLNANFDVSIKEGAKIFYDANVLCFTETTDFVGARECTLSVASQAQQVSVQAAWDAVGVRGTCPLLNNELKQGIPLPYDFDNQIYVLDETVNVGETVTCSLRGFDGDPDLYVQFGKHPDVTYTFKWRGNSCYSDDGGPVEECTTSAATTNATEVYIAVSTMVATLNYTIKCQINRPTCRSAGARCMSQRQCCGTFPFALACDGRTVASRTCKNCVEFGSRCARNSQCCGGLKCFGRTAATKRCILAKDPCHPGTRTLASPLGGTCKKHSDCCGTAQFGLVCDGPTSVTRECKPCKRDGSRSACIRSTQCCSGWDCRNKKCTRKT